jgi:hypothetical protein
MTSRPTVEPAGRSKYLIEAAKVADMQLDDECILERSRVVSMAPARMPFVGLKGRYNKRWHEDIVNLPHNAIRRQLSDLFTALLAMNKMTLDLTEPDFQLFYRYLSAEVDFFKAVLEGEEIALYECIPSESGLRRLRSGGTNNIQVLDLEYRQGLKVAMVKHLDDAVNHRFTMLPSMTTLSEIQESLDAFAKQALDYFAEKEEHLGPLLKRTLKGPREKTRFEARLLTYLLSRPRGTQLVVLLCMTLVSEEVRADFFERHFPERVQRKRFDEAAVEANNTLLCLPGVLEAAAEKYGRRFSLGAFEKHYGQDRDHEATVEIVA